MLRKNLEREGRTPRSRSRTELHSIPLAVAIVMTLLMVPSLRVQAQTVWGEHPDGSKVTELAPAGTHVLVLFFVASDCPISNRTFPEMKRLREKYASQGVAFWYVYPNGSELAPAVAEHQHSFDPQGNAMLARGPEIVRLAHVYATPEIAVLKREPRTGWSPIYAGRIDNRYVKFGLERPQATEHYGDDVIASVLAGRAVARMNAARNIVGCAIMNPGAHP
jgi:hypothetical protein